MALEAKGEVSAVRTPRLDVEWESPRSEVWSNLRAVLAGPKAPQELLHTRYFRTQAGGLLFPMRALAASILCHVALLAFPFPGWPERKAIQPRQDAPHYQLTWAGPRPDLKPLTPLRPKSPPKAAEKKPQPRRGADAFHPQQTIISAPKIPNHPRQTLIQPAAPPVAPKVLPPLPNIVQWSAPPKLQRPRLNFRAAAPKTRKAQAPGSPIEAPIIADSNKEKNLGPLNVSSKAPQAPKAKLSVRAASVPQPGLGQNGSDSAPDIGAAANTGQVALPQIVALSVNPAPPPPALDIPLGNLQSRFTMIPEGRQPGGPGGATNGKAEGNGDSGVGGASGGSPGPPGIVITSPDPKNTTTVAGLGGGSPRSAMANPLPAKPEPKALPGTPARITPRPTLEAVKPGTPPESILSSKRIYTLYVDAPNLTSATGSWILRFAEFNQQEDSAGDGGSSGKSETDMRDLLGPAPVRKVDPKYPPALRDAKVQGTVILYAIIRKDGSVDSIQLVKSLNPQLDQNAIEALARWKFRPAERHGEPVEIEAVVHIPFRAIASSLF